MVSACFGMLLIIMHKLNVFDRRDSYLIDRVLDHVLDSIFIQWIQIAHYRFYHFIRYVVKPQTRANFCDNLEKICF